MVRISSTGEILPDKPQARPSVNSNGQRKATRIHQTVANDDLVEEQARAQTRGGGPGVPAAQNNVRNESIFGRSNDVSLFHVVNQKLLSVGFPRWKLGGTNIEPIYSVAVLIALLLFGLPVLFPIAILYFVVKLSQNTETGSRLVDNIRNTLGGLWQGTRDVARNEPVVATTNNDTGNASSTATRPTANQAVRNRWGDGNRLGD